MHGAYYTKSCITTCSHANTNAVRVCAVCNRVSLNTKFFSSSMIEIYSVALFFTRSRFRPCPFRKFFLLCAHSLLVFLFFFDVAGAGADGAGVVFVVVHVPFLSPFAFILFSFFSFHFWHFNCCSVQCARSNATISIHLLYTYPSFSHPSNKTRSSIHRSFGATNRTNGIPSRSISSSIVHYAPTE